MPAVKANKLWRTQFINLVVPTVGELYDKTLIRSNRATCYVAGSLGVAAVTDELDGRAFTNHPHWTTCQTSTFDPPTDPHSPQHSRRQSLDLRHLRCSFGIIRSVEIIGETIPPFADMKKLSLGQPGVRHGDGRRFHRQ